MSATKQLNVRIPLEIHKLLDDHKIRTGEEKSDLIRRGIELALNVEQPAGVAPVAPTGSDENVDLVVWLSGRTGQPRALCHRYVDAGRVAIRGHAYRETCIRKADLADVTLDGSAP